MDRPLIEAFVQTTAGVEPERAYEYWRDTALAMSGVATVEQEQQASFSASRLVAKTSGSTLLHTRSTGIHVERSVRDVRQDDRDDMTIAVAVYGDGYFEQRNRGALLSSGDISLIASNQPFEAGATTAYEEIRLIVPRERFRTHVGEPDILTGRKIAAGPLNDLFMTYIRAYAAAAPRMSEAEAETAVQSALHLVRNLTDVAEVETPAEAIRSLAHVHIERHLHDPNFGVDALCRALRVSRSHLYAAFGDGEGVAATIRDARLDRAYKILDAPMEAGSRISTVMGRCGFTSAASFSNAFRRRFKMSARDVRGATRGRLTHHPHGGPDGTKPRD